MQCIYLSPQQPCKIEAVYISPLQMVKQADNFPRSHTKWKRQDLNSGSKVSCLHEAALERALTSGLGSWVPVPPLPAAGRVHAGPLISGLWLGADGISLSGHKTLAQIGRGRAIAIPHKRNSTGKIDPKSMQETIPIIPFRRESHLVVF